MTTAKRLPIALGVAGAMLAGNPGLSLAGGPYARATAAKSGAVSYAQPRRGYESRAHALSPRNAFDSWSQPPPSLPNIYQRPFLGWDPYGMRWDGNE
jgi:hypothetical protein